MHWYHRKKAARALEFQLNFTFLLELTNPDYATIFECVCVCGLTAIPLDTNVNL